MLSLPLATPLAYLAVPVLAAAAPALGSGPPVPVQPGLGLHTAAGTAGNKQPMQPGGLQNGSTITIKVT